MDVFGRKYFWGVGPGCGILREGIPVTTDDLDDFIDWPHPVVLNVTKYIGKVFNTKEYRWSPNLTKRLVFGVIYGMAGFSREELRGHAVFARECVIRHGMADAAIKNNDCFAFKDNPHPKRTWQIVSWYVNERFEEHGIKATPCELSHRQRSALRAKQLRERPTLPGFEAETPPTRSPPAVQETEQSSRVDFNTAYWEQVAKRNPTLYQKLIETESGITLPAGMAAARGQAEDCRRPK